MRRTWMWVSAAFAVALLVVLAASLLLSGLEELSWAAGTGSFVLAAALAWPRGTPSSQTSASSPIPSTPRVDNRMEDHHGTALQARDIHGPVTMHAPPMASPAPWWVETARPAHQADARVLGAHNVLPGPEGEDLPPYMARDVDGELDRRLSTAATAPRGGLALVTGASTAGKTRSLAQALGRILPERMLVAPPEDADLRPLPAWLKEQTARAPQGWVVWLDDLDRHLSSSGLTPVLVAELGLAGAVVAATIRQERLESLRPSFTDHTPVPEGVGYTVLKTPPVTLARRWSRHERERARASNDERLVEAAADERFGVAEQLAAGPHLQSVWDQGPDGGHPRGYALVAAAVGLARAGVSSPLTYEQLYKVHTVYLPQPPPLPEEADLAWQWATRPRSGQAGLLVPADHEGRQWRAFDYLTTQDTLPEAVWKAALDVATDQDRFTIGVTAHHADRVDIAVASYRPLAEQGDAHATVDLGVVLELAGRREEAEDWLRQAAEQGNTDGMAFLGVVLELAGRREEAEDWLRQAAEQGNTDATFNLGVVLDQAGRVEEAEDWYRKAADPGNTRTMVNLGLLLVQVGRLEEAEDWYRKAAEQGLTNAMVNLGLLLVQVGRLEEAEDWYRKAAERGNTRAMVNLGVLLEEADRVEEAEDWYRKAADQDDIKAMANLGLLLDQAGRLEEAEYWRQRAGEQESGGDGG